jgi:hypothetical protein
VLGTSASLMLSARVGDGATLGLGIALYFAYALLRRRIGWRAFVATAASFALVAGLTLVILRLQLGVWFKTGYSLAEGIWGKWATASFSMPKPNEWKYGAPIGYGSYLWWPSAPAIGAAGLILALRGRGRGSALVLGCGALVLTALCVAIEFGRGTSPGYGPRYALPLVVPMAVGGGVLLAPLFARARRAVRDRAFTAAGPATLAVVAMVTGALRIAPLVYPAAHGEVSSHSAALRAIEREHVHHAVVTVTWGDLSFDPLDLTQNLPLVPDPDVVILIQRKNGEDQCGREVYKDRYFYRAVGLDDAKLVPYDD